MKLCGKQNQPPRRPAQASDGFTSVHRYAHPIRTAQPAPRTAQRAVQPQERPVSPAAPAAPSPPPTELHRYVHPIRTARPSARPTTEELLGEVLEVLARHSELLEEALRRLERYNSDT